MHRFRAAVFLGDAALITMWCLATGRPDSEYWALYLIAIMAVAMRFDVLETLFSTLGLAALYGLVVSVAGGLSRTALLSRPALMLITGCAVGVLAKQRRTNQDQREVLVQIAKDRALAELNGIAEVPATATARSAWSRTSWTTPGNTRRPTGTSSSRSRRTSGSSRSAFGTKGPGIPKEQREEVFQRFRRWPTSRTGRARA